MTAQTETEPATAMATVAITVEQQHLDVLHARLEAMRAESVRRLRDVLRESGGTPQARSERESYNRLYTADLARFDAAAGGLCFGRIDTTGGEARHIGRIGILDPADEYRTLLLDWRAPLARPFYLATAASPDGVARRRHIRTMGSAVTAVTDEYLDAEARERLGDTTGSASHDDGVAGEAALLEALDRARTGHMDDIVATIQYEQDSIIRSAHQGVTVVQGGPGTGKTAVALHRAAYLLYTHRARLERSGVLVIGPNSTFLDYIGRVLPSLGETGVVLSTIGDLYPGIRARGPETLHAREVKGAALMVDVLRTAVRDRQLLPDAPRTLRVDGFDLTVTPTLVRRARGRARTSRRPHNQAREVFRDVLLDGLADLMAARLHVGIDEAPDEPGAGAPAVLDAADRREIRAELATEEVVGALVDELWPPLTASEVLADLLSDRTRLASAAPDLIEDDVTALHRADGTAFSPADAPLLDELAELLGDPGEHGVPAAELEHRRAVREAQEALDILTGSASLEFEDEIDSEILAAFDLVDAATLAERHRHRVELTAAERAAADRTWAFGHVIVDEAQELSAMAWRMVMRRSPNRWITAVGDTAQTGDPAGTDAWGDVFGPYVDDRWRLHELTVNYRTPAEIMNLAAEVLREIDPGRTVPRSIRSTGRPPRGVVVPTTDAAAYAAGIAAELGRVDSGRLAAVIAPADLLAELPPAPAGVRYLTVAAAKGLEFDAVVLADPTGLVDASPQGLQDLYVALTRATQDISIVHAGVVPYALRSVL